MGNHFRRGDRTQTAGFGERSTIRDAVQKSGGEQISGPRRVEDVVDRFSSDRNDPIACHDGGPEWSASDHGQCAVSTHRSDRRLEILGLVQ